MAQFTTNLPPRKLSCRDIKYPMVQQTNSPAKNAAHLLRETELIRGNQTEPLAARAQDGNANSKCAGLTFKNWFASWHFENLITLILVMQKSHSIGTVPPQ